MNTLSANFQLCVLVYLSPCDTIKQTINIATLNIFSTSTTTKINVMNYGRMILSIPFGHKMQAIHSVVWCSVVRLFPFFSPIRKIYMIKKKRIRRRDKRSMLNSENEFSTECKMRWRQNKDRRSEVKRNENHCNKIHTTVTCFSFH